MIFKMNHPALKREVSINKMLTLMKKKGISGVITAVIMIAVVMAAVVLVWGVVIPLIKNQLTETESCFGIFGEVTINSMYTCHNSSSNNFQFSINIGDIDVNEVLVSISGKGTMKSFEITNEEQTIANLANYSSGVFGTDLIKLPEKNAGLTYIASGFSEKPDLIQIAPVVKGKQCEISDSLSEIDDCSSLA